MNLFWLFLKIDKVDLKLYVNVIYKVITDRITSIPICKK